MNPQVSVIIPNYNRRELLGQTVGNLLRQTLPPREIIVVDDGSTDNSVEVVRGFGDKVRLLQQRNQGPGAARNAGLAVATGEFIQFQDSDDLLSLDKLERQVSRLQKEDGDICYGPWAKVHIADDKLSFEDHILQPSPLPSGRSMAEWMLMGWSTVLQACLFRRKLLSKIGPMRSDLTYWEDGEYLVRALLYGGRAVFEPECLTLYRLHDGPKLTGSGLSERRRLEDRSRVLPDLHARLASAGTLGRCSRMRLAFELRVLQAELRRAGGFEEAVQRIGTLARSYPRRGVQPGVLFRRVVRHIRGRFRGARWSLAYGSRFPSEAELRRVLDLGFDVGHCGTAGS